MPLLRGKPFSIKSQPEGLSEDEEVFFFDLTNEVFTDYDEFFERVILCNSLLWTCECTGHSGLTFKEAKESEKSVREALRAIPDATKRAVLLLVHQTKRSRIADLCEEIMDYLKKRYQEGEIVEVKCKEQWKKAKIEKVYMKPPGSPTCTSPRKAANDAGSDRLSPTKKTPKKSDTDAFVIASSFGGSPSAHHDDYLYDVLISKNESSAQLEKINAKQIRRLKGSLNRDLLRLLLRQTCRRTTAVSDDGYWIVEPEHVKAFDLGDSSVGSGPLSLETPSKIRNKRKRSSGISNVDGQSPKKRKSSDGTSDDKKQKKTKRGRPSLEKAGKMPKNELNKKNLTPSQRRKLLEKNRLKEVAEKEKLKKKKLVAKEKERERLKKAKEEEKQKKKVEKEKEKERTSELRRLEAEFLKGWTKVKDDLSLEDLKELPETTNLCTKFQCNIFGDIVMLVEFLNTFGTFYDIKDFVQQNITYDLLENALQEHDAEGVLYDIVKFLLQTFFTVTKEENEAEDDDLESNSGTATPAEPEPDQDVDEQQWHKHVSVNATAAAAWPMLHQGMALEELTIDPFTLSEILRLHILSSGVKIGGARNMWQRKGGFQFSDDPCVDFRHKEKSILTTLHTGCLYDLPIKDKLKILCVLCNQILTLTTTRDYIEDSFEKVKELKKKLRDLQNMEQKRRKVESAERWRKKLEESAKRKEEVENRKKEKESRENEKKDKSKEKGLASTPSKKKNKKEKVKKAKKRVSLSGEQNQSQEASIDQNVEIDAEQEIRKDDQAEKETEEELQKREEFKKQEKELIDEIMKYSAIRSEEPLGFDRIYNRYWSFRNVSGLLVEADSDARVLAKFITDEDDHEFDEDPSDDVTTKGDSFDGSRLVERQSVFPKVTLNEIISQRNAGKYNPDLLFTRYECKMDDKRRKLIHHSKIISSVVENVEHGLDPRIYAAERCGPLWSGYSTPEQLNELISVLNARGAREFKLKGKLEKIKFRLTGKVEQSVLFEDRSEEKPARAKPVKSDVVDKSLFKSMEDFLEANLRDQLLDLEERLWQASLGIIKVENRERWREDVFARINYLLMGKSCEGADATSMTEDAVKVKDENLHENIESIAQNGEGGIKIENGIADHKESPARTEVDRRKEEGLENESAIDDSMNSELCMGEDNDNSLLPKKSLPLKFIDQVNSSASDSRCSTPVTISTPMINPQVKFLASILLKIERGIDQKYLKPPIGEDEETKRERIREMIEAANAENIPKSLKPKRDSYLMKKGKSGKGDLNGNENENHNDDDEKSSEVSSTSEEALRKELTCLERWETSLSAATNFSQIFIHLNTLDRSIMWDKSVLNARCRICRKKGDAEKMLLCDGCDRGFHMYCLKPPVKKVPEGDWFCVDCRPKETTRTPRPRKRPVRLEEYVDDIDPSTAESDIDASEIENTAMDVEDVLGDQLLDDHEDFCAVCSEHGDLLCCDICSRAFHIMCVYPPIRKVPKGDWSCQVCTGADSDLPKSRRVTTIEREKEKLRKIVAASRRQEASRTRKSAELQKRVTNTRKRNSSPGPGPSRRVNAAVAEPRPSRASSRRSIGDPTSNRTRRSDAFGRYERRLCAKIVEELISADDGAPFILPVDTRDVPDYLDFIDHPMDLSKVKQKLNDGSYDALQAFIDDIRLIFSNCQIYNQPRSGVARAGSRLSIYFEQRLRELELVHL